MEKYKTRAEIVAEYEDSIERPAIERYTYRDSSGEPHFTYDALQKRNETYEYSLKCERYLQFGEQVDNAVANKLGSHTMLEVCETPTLLQNMGFRNRPMVYSQRKLQLALQAVLGYSQNGANTHDLTISEIKRMPELIENPVLICNSNSSPTNTIIEILLAVNKDKSPMLIAIKPDGDGRYEFKDYKVNRVLSYYGKDFIKNFYYKMARTRDILYYDNKKGKALERLSGVRFPRSYSRLTSKQILQQPKSVVNIGFEDFSKYDYQSKPPYRIIRTIIAFDKDSESLKNQNAFEQAWANTDFSYEILESYYKNKEPAEEAFEEYKTQVHDLSVDGLGDKYMVLRYELQHLFYSSDKTATITKEKTVKQTEIPKEILKENEIVSVRKSRKKEKDDDWEL